MIIFPVHDAHTSTRTTDEGCFDVGKLLELNYDGHFKSRIEEAIRDGRFRPTPGLWVVIDSGDGSIHDIRGMIFTITDTGQVLPGATGVTVPRLTSWPPKT